MTGVYRSADMIKSCLAALDTQTYRSFVVYAYDNSARGLLNERVHEGWLNDVSIVTLDENRGFAGGNNAAIRRALLDHPNLDYIVLLNDDTIPDPSWLAELISHADTNPQVGAISSKLVYYEPYARVRISTSARTAGPNDRRTIGVRLHEGSGFASSRYPNVFYRTGLHGLEGQSPDRFRWTADEAIIDYPFSPGDPAGLRLRLSPFEAGTTVVVAFAGQTHTAVLGEGINELEFGFDDEAQQRHLFDILQNVGNTLDDEFNPIELHSGLPDSCATTAPSPVDAACGAAMLLRTEAIHRTGLLSEFLFHYFEDTDLSLRLRKAGYEVHYLPSAKVRHYHAFSSGGEWSSSFTAHVVRNRVVFTALHGTKSQLWGKVCGNIRDLRGLLIHSLGAREFTQLSPHLAANARLLRDVPKALRIRHANRNL